MLLAVHSRLATALRAPYAANVALRLIDSHPSIMMGKAVITGTRITVESILERFAAGETIEAMVASHPRLTEEAVREALAFAADEFHSG
jgi:uncharacterized protein (DUF433 family)